MAKFVPVAKDNTRRVSQLEGINRFTPESYLFKLGRNKKWQERYFFFDNTNLCYREFKESKVVLCEIKLHQCDGARVSKAEPDQTIKSKGKAKAKEKANMLAEFEFIVLVSKKRKITLRAPSKELRDVFVARINWYCTDLTWQTCLNN